MTSPRSGLRRGALLAAFALSGFAGLAYQVTWGRILARAFGASAPALATVLAVFMGGLGVGALWAGRRADTWSGRRALGVYAVVEALVAAAGLLAPTLLDLTGDLYAQLAGGLGFGPAARGLARALTATLALAPPTLLMGASFPVLMRAVDAGEGETARLAGALQGANVVGAVLGAWGTGFVLLPALGDAPTTHVAAATNVAAAAIALGLLARAGGSSRTAPVAPEARGRPSIGLLAVALSTGALMLGYEVVWARVLVPLFAGTVHAASAVLGTVLLGLAIGAWIASAVGDRVRDPGRAFGGLALLAALLAGVGMHLVLALVRPALAQMRAAEDPWLAAWALPALLSAPLVLPASIASGLAFPIGVRAAAAEREVAAASGWLLAANTLGSIAGALAVGLWLLEALGVRGAAIALTLTAGAIPVAVLAGAPRAPARSRGLSVAAGAALAVVGLTLPPLDVRIFSGGLLFLPPTMQDRILAYGPASRTASELLYVAEGAETTVFVERTRAGRTVFIGGRPVASESALDLRNQYLLGHLPAILHGEPRRSLVVGLGAGTTAGALATHGPLDVCELSPAVVGAARRFGELNHRVVDRDGVRVVIEDGRTFLRARPTRYDVISVDPVHPHVAGAAALYTADYFALVRSRLAPGGVAAHWLPLYQLGWPEVSGVLRAWADTFPTVAVYLAGTDAVLLGGEDAAPPLLPRASELAEAFRDPAVRADLERVHLGSPARLAATGARDGPTLRRLVADARPLTDDHNWLEFAAATHARRTSPEPLERLVDARRDPPGDASPEERRAHASYGAVLRAVQASWAGAPAERIADALRRALAADPGSSELRARAAEWGVTPP